MMGAVTDATASADSRTFFVDVSGSSLPLGLDTPSYTLMAGMALFKLLVTTPTKLASFKFYKGRQARERRLCCTVTAGEHLSVFSVILNTSASQAFNQWHGDGPP